MPWVSFRYATRHALRAQDLRLALRLGYRQARTLGPRSFGEILYCADLRRLSGSCVCPPDPLTALPFRAG